MALQRPIPPPRRSIRPKSGSSSTTNDQLMFEQTTLMTGSTELGRSSSKEKLDDDNNVRKNLTTREDIADGGAEIDRRSITNSNDVDFRQQPNSNTTIVEDAEKHHHRWSSSSSSSKSIDKSENRARASIAVSDHHQNGAVAAAASVPAAYNPEYESATIPMRSMPGSRRTSNLIWFQSGVPPEFALKPFPPATTTISTDANNENKSSKEDLRENAPPPPPLSNPIVDDPPPKYLPSPLPLLPPPADLPPVAPLYPKLPPSPILPPVSPSSNNNWEEDNLKNELTDDSKKLELEPSPPPFSSGHSGTELALESDGRVILPSPPPPYISSSIDQNEKTRLASAAHSTATTIPRFRGSRYSSQLSWETARESCGFLDQETYNNNTAFADASEGSAYADASCNLVLKTASAGGSSVNSDLSDKTAMAADAVVESSSNNDYRRPPPPPPIVDRGPPEPAAGHMLASASATAVDRHERLRLTPVGTNVCNAGWLNKLGAKKKECHRRWCVLKNGVFEVYSDDASDTPVESLSCKSVEMVSTCAPTAQQQSEQEPHHAHQVTFSISFLAESRKLDKWTFSADNAADRLVWITLLTKCIVQAEAADLCEEIDRAGPLYLKKGTTADWEPGWFVMRRKVVLYGARNDMCCYEVDMRKVIRVRTVTDASDCCPLAQSQVPFAFVISTEGSALYAQSRDVTTSHVWRDAIMEALMARTGSISEERLATDDIPVIVEKCISFVAVHGLNTEGIYRHCGTQTKWKVLLELFMKDPYAVHLRLDEYTVHDVTSVLRKYFRQLDNPLITFNLRDRFIEISSVARRGSLVSAYKRILDELPLVNYNTLRKLLRHLKSVSQHSSKNMMTVENLAPIFGPTLFYVEKDAVGEGDAGYVNSLQASKVIADMINNYDELFNVDNSEWQKERRIEEARQRMEIYNVFKEPSQWLLSIHIVHKDANVFNMQITNKITASEVCSFAISHKNLSYYGEGQLALFEVICNGQLERIIGPDEKLLDIISRWTTWTVEERAANYVIVKPNYFKERLESSSASSLLTSCDVQFSESRSFRKCTFQCSKGEVLMYKNAKGTKPLHSWSADKLLWFFGCETRRQAPTESVLTFIQKDAVVQRSKTSPFFGHCVCFHDETSLVKWLATVTLSNTPLRTDF